MTNAVIEQQDVFELVKNEEANFKTKGVTLAEGWDWKMYDHVRTSLFYKFGRLLTGNADDKPVKNITRPILNLQYRAEGFDVKDIVLFIDDSAKYFKSFLVRYYHDKWARKNGLDTFIDEVVETYVDFGGALVKKIKDVRPVVVPWQSIAFCDQTNILSGPLAIKHFYSPDELLEMGDKGWGKESNGATATLEDVILLSSFSKAVDKKESKTPGKYIEVYEVHGSFPTWWLSEETDPPLGEETKYEKQLHIICFYTKDDGNREGITLFKGKEKESVFKLVLRDEIYGRALGYGGAEELFESQVWTNYSMIHKKNMLDSAAKTILKTTAEGVSKNKIQNMENLEILKLPEGADLSQVDTFPRNFQLFDGWDQEFAAHAQQTGAANDAIMGESPSAGTPFKLQELVTQEAHSLHEYRKGKLAIFIEEIYRDWIIPHIASEISEEQEWLAELDLDDLQYVADSLVTCETNKAIKEKVLMGQDIYPEEVEAYKELVRGEFMKGGNKKFMKILKGEMKNAPMSVKVNIVGKQKDLAQYVDKLTNVFRQVFSTYNPQTGTFAIFEDPRLVKLFNQILESSNLEPMSPYSPPKAIQQPAMVGAGEVKTKETVPTY